MAVLQGRFGRGTTLSGIHDPLIDAGLFTHTGEASATLIHTVEASATLIHTVEANATLIHTLAKPSAAQDNCEANATQDNCEANATRDTGRASAALL